MRVLVTAASRHGGTLEVADVIAHALTEAGLETALVPPDEVVSLRSYDALVLGSAVYYGQWLPTALDLVRRNRAAIKKLPVWLFSVGPLGAPEPQPVGEPAVVAELAERTNALGHRVFAGALDRSRLGIVEKVVASAVRAPEGDFRDWVEIRHWAQEIAREIQLGRAVRRRA
jgi:menaquinone-dependent protoporphyrinogen oxidase